MLKGQLPSFACRAAVRALAALAVLAAPSALADGEGYADDFVSIGDGSVRALLVGSRHVYVFTNAASVATVKFLQPMTLKEALLVGGGGAGGGTVGGGGGGGGVVSMTSPLIFFADEAISVTVGAGGVPLPASKWYQGGGGGASSLARSGSETALCTAFGGGGGAGYGCSSFVIGSWGSSGGGSESLKTAEKFVEGLHYTAGQGNPGATGAGGYKYSGGGGGAAAPGSGINGGEGVTNSITGADEVYGSGGSGVYRYGSSGTGKGGTNAGGGNVAEGVPGVDGFGGGGSGGSFGSYNGENKSYAGGRGGCGTVILSFEEGGSLSQPEISAATLTFPYGTTQPQADVTVGAADSGGVVSATVTVSFGTTAECSDYARVFAGVGNGDSVSVQIPASPQQGETVYLTVKVESPSLETRTKTVSASSDNPVSPYSGKGGGAGVIHVRPGATGLGDGSDWFHAATSLRDAIALISAERPELWLSGDEVGKLERPKVAPEVEAAIRGGFTGLESAPGDRAPGAKSVCDAQSFNSCFVFANAQPLTLDGFELTAGAWHNLEKSGAGDLTVTNCTFRDTTGQGPGRGAFVTGASGATVRFVDVRFSKIFGGGTCSSNVGTALYAKGCGRLVIDDCTFANVGYTFSYAGGNNAYDQNGAAIYADGAPLTVRRTLFAGNQSQSLEEPGGSWGAGGGGVVRVSGSCGETAFTNCLFVGNAVVHGYNNFSLLSSKSGVLALSPSAGSVDVVNCTFAHGSAGVTRGAAGISQYGGSLRVLNSIFYGNTNGTMNAAATDIQIDGGTAEVAYCLFEDGSSGRVACAEGAEATLRTDTFVYGDPRFATDASPGEYVLAKSVGTGFLRLDSARLSEIVSFSAHLRGAGGYLDETTGETVRWRRERSPAIDAGDPATDWQDEAAPNGRRVNLGRWGNTPYATCSVGGLIFVVR